MSGKDRRTGGNVRSCRKNLTLRLSVDKLTFIVAYATVIRFISTISMMGPSVQSTHVTRMSRPMEKLANLNLGPLLLRDWSLSAPTS